MSHFSALHCLSHADQRAQLARGGRTHAQARQAAAAILPSAPLRLPTLRLAARTKPAAPTKSLIAHVTAEVNAFAQQSSDLDDTTKEVLREGLRAARTERLELIETAPAPQIKTLPALPLTTERQLLEDLR